MNDQVKSNTFDVSGHDIEKQANVSFYLTGQNKTAVFDRKP